MINRIYYGWWIVLAAFSFAAYVGGTIFFGFTAFFEPIVKEFGWSYAQISFVITLRGLEMGIFAPVVGFLVDRFGSRKLAIFGAVTIGIGLIVLSRSNTLLSFYGAFIIIGFGAGGCTSVVLMTAVANWFKKNIGKALGVMACGFGAGGFLVPVVVWLIAQYGWRTALVVIGVTMWCVGIPLAFVIRNNPAPYGGLPPQEQLPDEEDGSGKKAVVEEIEFKVAARSADFWYMNLAEAIRMMVLTSVVTHVMPYLSSIGISTYTAGFVAGGIPLASIIGRFGFGWMADILRKKARAGHNVCMHVRRNDRVFERSTHLAHHPLSALFFTGFRRKHDPERGRAEGILRSGLFRKAARDHHGYGLPGRHARAVDRRLFI